MLPTKIPQPTVYMALSVLEQFYSLLNFINAFYLLHEKELYVRSKKFGLMLLNQLSLASDLFTLTSAAICTLSRENLFPSF